MTQLIDNSEFIMVEGIPVVILFEETTDDSDPNYPIRVHTVAFNGITRDIYLEGTGVCDDSEASCHSVNVFKKSIRAQLPKAIWIKHGGETIIDNLGRKLTP